MAIAKSGVERNQMRGLFGGVHRELCEPMLRGPLLDALQQHAAYAGTLLAWINRELMRSGYARTREVLALVLCVGGLDHDGSDQRGLGGGDKTGTATNALGCHFGCLIYGRVVQSHVAQARIGTVDQWGEIVDGVGLFEGADVRHG